MMSVARQTRQLDAASAQLIDIRDRFGRDDPDDRDGLFGSVDQLHDLLDAIQASESEIDVQVAELIEEHAAGEAERQRYRQLLDLVPLPALMTSPSGLIELANRAAADLLGVRAAWMIGKPLAAFIVGRTVPATLYQRLRQLQNTTDDPLVCDAQLRARGGGAFAAHITVSALRLSTGEVAGLQWVIRKSDDADAAPSASGKRLRRVLKAVPESAPVSHIEARRELLASAEGAAAYYRGLFDGALDAVVLFDPERRLFDGNPAAHVLLGYADRKLERLRLDDLAVGDAEKIDAVIASLQRDGCWRGELDLRRKDGETVQVEAAISTVASPVGLTFRAALRDVTAARRGQEGTARAQRESVAMVSHELRTPLSGIKLHAEILKVTESYREASVDAILTSVRCQEKLIEDLLDLARFDAKRVRLQPSRVNLVPLLLSCVAMTEPQTSTHDVRLHAPAALPSGCWDEGRILQVFDNLLSNAAKYSPSGSQIRLCVEDLRDCVQVSVVDRGIGIEAAALPYVFDRFFRADSGKRRAPGAGLGLHIVKTLVEAHGGSIIAESVVGAGSAFRVTLPYEPSTHANSVGS